MTKMIMGEKRDSLETGMSQEEFQNIMERIESSNAGQEKYARKQYRMAQITAGASLIILAVVIYAAATLIPAANRTFQNLNFIMEDLQTVTEQLAEADLSGMISDVDTLVSESEKGVSEALKKIEAIDIDTLNSAIQNLNDAVAPLANFFNRFN